VGAEAAGRVIGQAPQAARAGRRSTGKGSLAVGGKPDQHSDILERARSDERSATSVRLVPAL
jgi:hypothetical protein